MTPTLLLVRAAGFVSKWDDIGEESGSWRDVLFLSPQTEHHYS